jgi:hypothetical protein
MSRSVSVNLDEVLRVFEFLEAANDLLHQPLKYRDAQQVEKFASEHYQQLKELYYDVVWNWIPEEVREELEER